MTHQADILIVDDSAVNLELLSSLLIKEGYFVRPALNGQIALSAAKSSRPDLILLDIDMPELDGYEVCQKLKADADTEDIPVIFVSALNEILDKTYAFHVGGVDYITKPYQIEELTARIETHLTLARQRAQLEQQYDELQRLREKERHRFTEINKMKDHFVYTVSHDLRNPIGVIVGYADLLIDSKTLTTSEDKDLVLRIKETAERMNTLIVELLDLARIESGMSLSPETVSLAALLAVCVEQHFLNAEQKSIALRFIRPEPDSMVYLDVRRMEQILNNLLSNAIKYTPEGKTVTLSAETRDHQIRIVIEDTGLGIPEDAIPKIFDRFYRVSRPEHMRVQGTGLGLAIVKAIVEQHGGEIEVESVLGEGTRFIVKLPIRSSLDD